MKPYHDVLYKRWNDSRVYVFANKDFVCCSVPFETRCTKYLSIRNIVHFPTGSIYGVYGVHEVLTMNSDNFRKTL